MRTVARWLRRVADWIDPPDAELIPSMFTYDTLPQGDGTTMVIPQFKSLTAEPKDWSKEAGRIMGNALRKQQAEDAARRDAKLLEMFETFKRQRTDDHS